jgi:hypothetical protein
MQHSNKCIGSRQSWYSKQPSLGFRLLAGSGCAFLHDGARRSVGEKGVLNEGRIGLTCVVWKRVPLSITTITFSPSSPDLASFIVNI